MHRATIGMRIKSGWAMAVLLAGPTANPRVVERRRIALSDPRRPRTRQPYHAGFGLAQTSRRTIAALVRVVERCARRSVGEMVRDARARGLGLRGTALVVGSVTDPASISNPHIRAHASEGALFRRVVADAAARLGLRSVVVVEREVYKVTARATRRPARQVRAMVAELGNSVEGSWRAEEKTAAAAAWLALAKPPRQAR
jgi:hypothetical protein